MHTGASVWGFIRISFVIMSDTAMSFQKRQYLLCTQHFAESRLLSSALTSVGLSERGNLKLCKMERLLAAVETPK